MTLSQKVVLTGLVCFATTLDLSLRQALAAWMAYTIILVAYHSLKREESEEMWEVVSPSATTCDHSVRYHDSGLVRCAKCGRSLRRAR